MAHRPMTVLLLAAVAGCYPATTRPDVTPMPDAARVEVELFVPQAMRALAIALDADSIRVRRTEPDDGWLESEWIDAVSLQPISGRPLGLGAVKVRAFGEPGRPNHTLLIVETVYRPVADPSRPDRDLERQVPAGHPVAARVARILDQLHD
jgi:hypothetical protein